MSELKTGAIELCIGIADIGGAYDEARAAERELQSLRSQLGAAEAEQWIPVSERVPNDEDVCVLCTDADGDIRLGYYSLEGEWQDVSYRRMWVAAWRPLPTPYAAASPPPAEGR